MKWLWAITLIVYPTIAYACMDLGSPLQGVARLKCQVDSDCISVEMPCPHNWQAIHKKFLKLRQEEVLLERESLKECVEGSHTKAPLAYCVQGLCSLKK